MERFVAVLGRQPLISVAELESLFSDVKMVAPELAEFSAEFSAERPGEEFLTRDGVRRLDIHRLGGVLKIGVPVNDPLEGLPEEGKITLGVSDFSRRATAFLAQKEALSLKRRLVKQGRSVRVVANKTAVLSGATSLHNGLGGRNPGKVEFLKNGKQLYRVIQLSDLEKYAARDRERPARDAKVGMLPPKLAQVLINLCGPLPEGARVLDPFCGTGVLLQEAALDGFIPYGTDISERMIGYSRRNLEWLKAEKFELEAGDATSHRWQGRIDAVACEVYLGPPMSQVPAEVKLREAKTECKGIVLGFLRNLAEQIPAGTPVVIAVPAWLRGEGRYERLGIVGGVQRRGAAEELLDENLNLRYNVCSFKNLGQKDLLYARAGQVVAREIIVLRKK